MSRPLNLIAIILLLFPSLGFALVGDDHQTIHIVADSSTFNYKTGNNLYEGNVKVDQGTTHLTADRLTTSNNDKHKIQEAIAYGIHQLADYSTTPKQGDKPVHAKAKVIRFFPIKSLVQLEGDVIVTQGDNSFHGPFIIYNMKDQIVTAPASETGRTTIVIEPNK